MSKMLTPKFLAALVRAVHRVSRICGLLSLIVASTSHEAAAFEREQLGQYTFEQIAATGDSISSLSSPKLTAAGDIAYWSYSSDGTSAVYLTHGSNTNLVLQSGLALEGGRIDFITDQIDINDLGVVAFDTSYIGAIDSAVFGLYTIAPSGTITRRSTNSPSTYFYSDGMSINNRGDVAYVGNAGSYADIYLSTASGVTQIFHGGNYNRTPSIPVINEFGTVTFSGSHSSVGQGDEVYVYNSGKVTKIDTAPSDHASGQPFILGFIGNASVNDLGQIAYVKEDTSYYDTDVILYEHGQYTKLVTGTAEPSGALINNVGAVALNGINSRGFKGIRTCSAGSTTDVLGYGDMLFGRAVRFANFWDLNDRGQLALTVQFTDGLTSIVLATPVPEPGTVWLILAGLPIMLAYRGRRPRADRCTLNS